ncbi:MAG: DNA-directed DNA polymerase [Candidatus Micrarchaeota archaeon]
MLKKAYFIDADYIVKDNETYVRLYLKGKRPCRRYYKYLPYFYADAPIEKKDLVLKVKATLKTGEVASVERVEQVTKILGMEKKKFLKIYCREPAFVPVLKAAMPFTCYEYAIPFAKRFMLDFGLTPFSIIKYEVDGKFIKKIRSQEETEMSLKTLAFDIETYNPKGAPREEIDPVIMISWHGKTRGVATYKRSDRKFVKTKKNEKEALEEFGKVLKEEDPDVLLGYNSTNFDFPYLEKRSEILRTNLQFGRWPGKIKSISKGMINGVKLNGRIHIDLYPPARFFGFIGLIKTNQYTLEAVYASITGKGKKMVQRLNIWEIWDSNEIDELADYSLMDADATDVLGKEFLPILKELSIITKMPLFEVSISTSGQLVEQLLMFNAAKHEFVIPPKPRGSEIQERMGNPIQGAYVKLPKPGIYENIAVLDFRGLYPSIITSYNISPETVADSETNDVHVAPDGTRFMKKPKGIIPMVLEDVIEARSKIKKQLKSLSKDSEEYKRLNARQFSLKILANSFYGFSVYPRARWYSRKCGASTTAWGREHIQNTIAEAGKKGMEVLYSDTDSVFLIYKHKNEVLEFMEKVNKKLPERMELELEAFYPRGVFVTKKVAGKDVGAKKKYALISEDGRIKIRGFELVRRDWSGIARNTQRKVLEAILKDGSKEKAVEIVQNTIKRLKEGKVNLEELAISTQISKPPSKYEIKSPEISAALKAIERGVDITKGSIIRYVVTKKGKTISEKAEPLEFAKDYDVDYYINNQLLPAVMKILKELGFDETDLKVGGKQKGLESFF